MFVTVAVDDEIWRPGYTGPPPVIARPVFDAEPIEADPGAPAPAIGGWRRRTAALGIGAMLLVSGVVVVVLRTAPDAVTGAVSPPAPVVEELAVAATRTDVEETSGPPLDVSRAERSTAARRLPNNVVPRWTSQLAPLVADGGANATTWVEAVGGRYVVVGIGDARSLTGPAAVHVLDAATGDRMWSIQVDNRIDQVDYVASIDEMLVLTVGDEIVAHDLRDGTALWSGRLGQGDGRPPTVERLEGTDLLGITREDGAIEVVNPATGSVVVEMVGDLVGVDRLGRPVMLRGDKLLAFDLGDAVPGPPGTSELVAAVDADATRFVAVVGDALIGTVDDGLALGRLTEGSDRPAGPDGLTPLRTDFGRPDSMVLVRDVVPLGDVAFVTVGGGVLGGAEITGDTIRFAWQRRGVATGVYPTDDGVVLLVGTDGGAAQTLVDGATGETIASLTMTPGLFDALTVAANGIVTLRTSRGGPRVAGLDMNGTELWSLSGAAPVSVGDGVVVRSLPQPDGSFVVTAYGSLA